jgi:hypothetical protein
MMKALKKLEGACVNITKGICNKLVANIILNGEKLKPFPLKAEIRQKCPFSPLSFNLVLKFLARAIKQ